MMIGWAAEVTDKSGSRIRKVRLTHIYEDGLHIRHTRVTDIHHTL